MDTREIKVGMRVVTTPKNWGSIWKGHLGTVTDIVDAHIVWVRLDTWPRTASQRWAFYPEHLSPESSLLPEDI